MTKLQDLSVGDLVEIYGCIAWKFKPNVHFNRSSTIDNRAWSFENGDIPDVTGIVVQLPDCGDALCGGLVRVITNTGYDVIVEKKSGTLCNGETRSR